MPARGTTRTRAPVRQAGLVVHAPIPGRTATGMRILADMVARVKATGEISLRATTVPLVGLEARATMRCHIATGMHHHVSMVARA